MFRKILTVPILEIPKKQKAAAYRSILSERMAPQAAHTVLKLHESVKTFQSWVCRIVGNSAGKKQLGLSAEG